MNALRTIGTIGSTGSSPYVIFPHYSVCYDPGTCRKLFRQRTLLLDYYLKSPGGTHRVYFGIIVISLFFISSSSVEVLIYNHNIPRYPPSRRRMHFFLFHRGVFEICLIIGFPYNNNNNNNTRGTVYIPVHRHIHVRENKIQNVPRSRAR